MTALVRVLSFTWIYVGLFAGISLAEVPDSYTGLSPLIGDVHQHTLSPQDAQALASGTPNTAGYCTGFVGSRHEFGFPPLVLDEARSHGYDWTNLSPHMLAGMTENSTASAYTWWTSSTLAQPIFPGDPSAIKDVYYVPGSSPPTHHIFRRSTQGYPFYRANDPNFLNLGDLEPPWSYWLSNGTAADSRTVPGSYVAFAGAEMTTFGFFPGPSGAAGTSGHRLVVMPSTVRGCSVDANGNSTAAYCNDEFELDRWVVQNGGLIVQAHPTGWPSMPTLHPRNSPAGFSESVVMGMEIGGGFNGFVGPNHESSIRAAMTAGYRVFPAFGSDAHQRNDPYCGPFPIETPGVKLGGTVCWASSFDRPGLIDAMKARRCYFSNGYEPTLKLEACSDASCSGGVAKMGEKLTLSGTIAYVRLSASNDLRNQEPTTPYPKRFDRLELVHQSGLVLLGQSCTRGTNGGGANPAVPDTCSLGFTPVTLPATSGGFYARVCTLTGTATTCADNGTVFPGSTPTLLVSAPIFVNWDQYRTTTGKRYCEFDTATIPCQTPGCLPSNVDSDVDGYPNTCDTCPVLFDPDQLDADRSGFGNLCNDSVDTDGDEFENAFDNCASTSNANQADADQSGIGDACNSAFDPDGDEFENAFDNCASVANANQADLDGDQIGDVCDPDRDGDGILNASDNCPNTASSNQTDSDGDSAGDVCDNCTGLSNPDQADSDFDYGFSQGLFARADGVGDACDNCVNVYNPPPATPPPANRTTTGGQIDDDADGYGNSCDLDYDNDGVVGAMPDAFYGVCGEDADYYVWSFETGAPATANSCGASGTLRCELFDFDGDGILNSGDTLRYLSLVSGNFGGPAPIGPKCPSCPRACSGDACSPPDSDGDGRTDPFDNCPTIANADQADTDGDAVGQVCDSCTTATNRRVPIGCVSQLGWLTTTGGQRDDDHDGYGNKCDAKFTSSGVFVGSPDLSQFRASQDKDRTLDLCGTIGTRPCAIFDLDEENDTIDALDLDAFRALNGKLPGPRCATCPLVCATGTAGTCN